MKRLFLMISVLVLITLSVAGYIHHRNKSYTAENAHLKNSIVNISDKMNVAFTPEGIDDIALITMVKNEEDIIFENLVWHFTIGFRKFVIVDNQSNDNTRKRIEKFAELTKNQAKVMIIDDPIFEHIQSRIMTGAYEFAKSVWPELTWVFPVDADEFWIPGKPLQSILDQVPDDIDAITTLCAQHRPMDGYYDYPKDLPFYERIPYRVNSIMGGKLGKTALRATNRKNLVIAQGNHSIKNRKDYPKLLQKKLHLVGQIKYASGNALGLNMTEFSLRSIEQTHKKLSNGAKANMAAQNLGFIHKTNGSHWNEYAIEMQKFGDNAPKKRFDETFISKNQAVNDPLPMKDSFALFYKIIDKK